MPLRIRPLNVLEHETRKKNINKIKMNENTFIVFNMVVANVWALNAAKVEPLKCMNNAGFVAF